MSVRSCVEYYNRNVGNMALDVDAVAAEVQAAKEPLYQELTAGGISACDGARPLILEAKSVGVAIGVGSSGNELARA
jgi:hypothetical protein